MDEIPDKREQLLSLAYTCTEKLYQMPPVKQDTEILRILYMNRDSRSNKAAQHIKDMHEKYSREIKECIEGSLIYGGPDKTPARRKTTGQPSIKVTDLDTVSAVFKFAQEADGVCVLNFASYRHPGGGFVTGSMAQEEALCHESILYNVLRELPEFYSWNANNLNHSLYQNRAIFTPKLLFERDGENARCDVLTCASPNLRATLQNGYIRNSDTSINTKVLSSRIEFIFDVLADNNIKRLITGAFGCGVFGQNPREVAEIFIKAALNSEIEEMTFAVPKGNGNNEAIYSVVKNLKATTYSTYQVGV